MRSPCSKRSPISSCDACMVQSAPHSNRLGDAEHLDYERLAAGRETLMQDPVAGLVSFVIMLYIALLFVRQFAAESERYDAVLGMIFRATDPVVGPVQNALPSGNAHLAPRARAGGPTPAAGDSHRLHPLRDQTVRRQSCCSCTCSSSLSLPPSGSIHQPHRQLLPADRQPGARAGAGVSQHVRR